MLRLNLSYSLVHVIEITYSLCLPHAYAPILQSKEYMDEYHNDSVELFLWLPSFNAAPTWRYDTRD